MSQVQAQLMAFKQTATRWQPLYVPDRFASIEATAAGPTDIWVALDNFILMGFSISVCGTLAAAEELVIEIVDVEATITIAQFSCFLPATATGGANAGPFGQDFGGGYGYQSSAISTTLAVNLSAALTSGHVCVNAWGVWAATPDP